MIKFEEVEIAGRRRQVRRWVPDPDMWPLAERAWRLRLSGASYQTILRECPGLYRSEGCLATFFRNTIYKGELVFGGTAITVKEMVTPEEWGRVNHRRHERHGSPYPRHRGGAYLLTGLIRCGQCGRALVGHRTSRQRRRDGYERSGWRGYRCPGRRTGACDMQSITASPLEAAVIAQLLDDILSPETLADQWDRIARARDQERPAIEARIAVLEAQCIESAQSIDRLLDAIERAPNSAALLDRLATRERDHEDLLYALATAVAVREAANVGPPDVATLREQIRETLDHRDDAARAVLRRFIEEIQVAPDHIARVRYRVPF